MNLATFLVLAALAAAAGLAVRSIRKKKKSGGCSGFTWADGNMVEKNDTTGYGNWTKTTVYADFLAGVKNAPQTDYQVDRYGQKYVGTYTYDAQGRLLTYVTTKVKEAEIDDNHHMSGVVLEENHYKRVVYTYEDGVLTSRVTSYWNATAADFVPSSKVAYSVDADGGRCPFAQVLRNYRRRTRLGFPS